MKVQVPCAMLLVAVAVACGDDADPACEGPSSVDCAPCAPAELCWYTQDVEGCVMQGCIDYPAACEADRTCGCLDATATSSPACDALDLEQNSGACEVRGGRPVLSCVSTLG